jgi:hypothetical protein
MACATAGLWMHPQQRQPRQRMLRATRRASSLERAFSAYSAPSGCKTRTGQEQNLHRFSTESAPARGKTRTAPGPNPHRRGAEPAPPRCKPAPARSKTRTASVQNPHRPGAKSAPPRCKTRTVPEQNPHRFRVAQLAAFYWHCKGFLEAFAGCSNLWARMPIQLQALVCRGGVCMH